MGRVGTDPLCQEQFRIAVRSASAARVPGVVVGRAEHTALLLCLCCRGVPVSRRGCGKDPQKPPHVRQPWSKGSASGGKTTAPTALGCTVLLGAIAFSRKFPFKCN